MRPLGLELDYPLIQSPMAGVQDVELAVAVTAAGGLGSLPAAMLSNVQLDQSLSQFRQRLKGPINVNFFCHRSPKEDQRFSPAWLSALQPFFDEFGIDSTSIAGGAERRPFSDEACEVLEHYRPEVVSFHFGLPRAELVNRVHGMGSLIAVTATTVEEALWLQAHGADLIIAQGLEAGGHRGHFLSSGLTHQLPMEELLHQCLGAIDLPVIAAGGIGDSEQIKRCLDIGASAVQVGTIFLLCDEATTSDVHRRALTAEAGEKTCMTNVFSGRPARGIVNRAIQALGPMSAAAPAFPQAAAAITALRQKCEAQGSGDFSPLWSGQNTRGCDAVAASEIVQRLMESNH